MSTPPLSAPSTGIPGIGQPLLQIDALTVMFDQYERGLRRREVLALSGMDLSADTGELVALVGASGAGKSLLAHAVLGMLPPNAREGGRVTFDGQVVSAFQRRRLAGRELMLLPQSVSFLDPVTSVGAQVRRSARLAGRGNPRRAAVDALAARGLDADVLRRFPHELSGGMARRVLVAMATMSRPRLVIADEPTPGLPAAQAAAILQEFRDLADGGCAVVLITHDVTAVLDVADRIVVCDHGRTVEVAAPSAFSGDGAQLTDPYTRSLWQALPGNGFRVPAAALAPSEPTESEPTESEPEEVPC